MLISCNGIRVLSGEIVMPRIGTWVADMKLDGPPPTGRCTIVVGETVSFVGTALPIDTSAVERHSIKVVGGNGGLDRDIQPMQHRGAPTRIVLASILAEAGETLSPTADAGTLGTQLLSWSRMRGRAGYAIAELLRDTAASWRILADGTLWVGPETWPELKVEASVIPNELDDMAEIATDLPVLLPGVTYRGRHVSAVTHRFEPERVRTTLYFERGTPRMDRLKEALFGLARAATSRVDYFGQYAATVVAQQLNGDLQVRFDDDRFRREQDGTGHAGVRRWPGVPGISYVLRQGARVLVGFLDGKPNAPIVTGWNAGTPERVTLEADRINLGESATRGVARLNDTVAAFTVSAGPGPLPNTGVIVITPPGGAPITIGLAATGLAMDVVLASSVVGTISSASSKSFAE